MSVWNSQFQANEGSLSLLRQMDLMLQTKSNVRLLSQEASDNKTDVTDHISEMSVRSATSHKAV